MASINHKASRTTEFFYKIYLIVYFFGFPNFWIQDLKLSKQFISIYNRFNSINNKLIYVMILSEYGAFYTQRNLTDNQRFNLWLYAFSHPILCSYRLIMTNQEKDVRMVLYNLTVGLKKIYSDPEVEKQMIRSTMRYTTALTLSCVMSVAMYNFDAYMEVVHNDLSFTTLITAYPDVHDGSASANIVRLFINLMWWIFVSRVIGVYCSVIPLATCLSHQYKNLQSYFYSLDEIFYRNDLSQKEKEDQYERQFKIGIKLHSDTLRCTQETHSVCRTVFSGQIIFNIVLIVVLMAQMVKSERTLSILLVTSITATAVLISTGLLMWNAGDITVEASQLSMSMYFSGWHNCQGPSSVRIRKLVTIAMTHAQRPVVLKGLGYIVLSYQSYLTIVKTSYSMFSVLF